MNNQKRFSRILDILNFILRLPRILSKNWRGQLKIIISRTIILKKFSKKGRATTTSPRILTLNAN